MEVASYLMDKRSVEKSKDKIVPVITKDEILFFDHKQLSILNGYTDGFRIIRGVAGTGKTIILTNFVQNKLQVDDTNKFLVLCFNKKLADNLSESFDERYHKNIASYSLFGLLYRIKFDFEAVGISQKTKFDDQMQILKTQKATEEFEKRFSKHLQSHPIDYFLCDETQDMPANIMRVIYEQIHDCIFFIDEAQKFFSYSMDSIAEVFKHPDFEQLSMQGRVKNLKNVYRTPSNIARCAFEILSQDTKLNKYYRKSYYLKEGFLDDVKFILEDGGIEVGEWDSLDALKQLIDKIDDETVILTQYKKSKYKNSVSVESLEEYIRAIGKEDQIHAMTFQSIKGLEAKNVVLHNFDEFLRTVAKYDKEIMYRKVYVLFTRALENLYISLESVEKLQQDKEIADILEIVLKYQKISQTNKQEDALSNEEGKTQKLELSKLKPKVATLKEAGEVVIVASELFALVAGLFS